MALIAMTVSDGIEHVSDKDPAKKKVKTITFDQGDGPMLDAAPEFEIGPDATRFYLKSLDVFLMAHIYDNASTLTGKQGDDNIGIQTRVNQTNLEAVRHGLTGWKNFVDKNGKHARFETKKIVVNGREYEVADDATMSYLGLQLIMELATRIKEISEVSKEEEKNSAKA